MNYITRTAAMIASLSIASAATATEYVVNGDFTQLSNGLGQLTTNTIATGWNVPSGGYTFVFSQADQAVPGQYGSLALWDFANGGSNGWNGQAPAGGNFAAIDGDFQNQPLQQMINGLTPGAYYNLSFWAAFGQQQGFNGPTIQSIDLTFGTEGCCGNSGNINVSSHGFDGWFHANVKVRADDTSDLLSFAAHGNLPIPPFAMIADVSLTGSAPEPAAWAMMLIGVAGLGAVARRRRANASTSV